MKEKSYKAAVYLDMNGKIQSTECECPRGSFKCSHAAALYIHAIHNLSRTDIECNWKRQKLTAEVKTISEMYPPPREGYRALTRNVTSDDKNCFFSDLKKCGTFTGLAWFLAPEPPTVKPPFITVDDILSRQEFVQSENQESYLFDKLSLTDDEIVKLEKITKGQRKNPYWLMLRKGRLTASNFGSVLNAKKVTPSLLERLMRHRDLSGVHAINWGISHEDEAIKVVTDHTGLCVEESGLWLNNSGILGASPDGLIGDDSLIEVKCPYTHRSNTIGEAMTHKDFYLVKINDKYELKKDHIYWHQVQGQLCLTKRANCYFIVWTLKEMVIIDIPKDSSWQLNLNVLEEFYKMHMIKRVVEE